MKSASVADIRREVKQLSAIELQKITELLAKYNNDNKAYLTYLLYEAHDRATYIQNVKDELREGFASFSAESNLYFSKKTLRKLLRQVTKYAKYTGDKAVLCELLIYYCELLNESKMPFRKSQVLLNLYNRIIATIEKACTSLHEDLQADYFIQIEALKD